MSNKLLLLIKQLLLLVNKLLIAKYKLLNSALITVLKVKGVIWIPLLIKKKLTLKF